jgi:hypothetical protein
MVFGLLRGLRYGITGAKLASKISLKSGNSLSNTGSVFSNSTNKLNSFATGPQKMLLLFLIIVIIIMIGVKLYSLYVDTKIYMSENNMYLKKPRNSRCVVKSKGERCISCYQITNPDEKSARKKLNGLPADRFQAPTGVFTYNFWIYVNGISPDGKPNDDWGSYKFGKWKHIFHRGAALPVSGEPPLPDTNIPDPRCYMIDDINVNMRQLPGFYLAPTLNNLYCKIRRTNNASDIESEQIVIEDIPMNKWTNIVFVYGKKNMSIYKNGKLERTVIVFMPINMNNFNNDKLYITQGGGFAGRLWNLQYFPSELEPDRIYKMYKYYLSRIEKDEMSLVNNKKKCDDCDDDDDIYQDMMSEYEHDKKEIARSIKNVNKQGELVKEMKSIQQNAIAKKELAQKLMDAADQTQIDAVTAVQKVLAASKAEIAAEKALIKEDESIIKKLNKYNKQKKFNSNN